jgi:hypothetical protein
LKTLKTGLERELAIQDIKGVDIVISEADMDPLQIV